MLVYGHDEYVANWVAERLRLRPYEKGLFRAIGVTDNHQLIAGIVYNNFILDSKGRPLLIEMTIASVDKHWCTRHNLKELFAYPFIHLGVKRVQATCSRKAKRVRKFLQRLGFRLEGIMREGCPTGGDAAHFSMLHNECTWIDNGKIDTFSSGSTRSRQNGAGADCQQ